MTRTEQHISELIQAAIDEYDYAEFTTSDFIEDGVMTSNAGFTVKLENGQEYQVSIVRSR